MKINIVVNSFPSTSETFLFNLVIELEKRGYDITVCAFSKMNNLAIYRDRIHQWSGKISYIPSNNWLIAMLKVMSIFADPKSCISLMRENGLLKGYLYYLKLRALSKNNPDIIHFAFSGIAVSMLPILDTFPANTRLFVSCRGTAEKITPIINPERAKQLSQVFAKIDRIHCVSDDMKQSLIQYGLEPGKAFVNYPSVNSAEFFPRSERKIKKTDDTIVCVTTGRLNYVKGYSYAIGAIANLIKKGYRIEYRIIGDGPDMDMLKYMIHEKDLEDAILLTGKISLTEVNQHLQQADIFILPSLSEGISNAVLEAMSLEIPTISTDAGGMKEVIRNGQNGLLVNRYSETDLSDALTYLIKHQEEAVLMGKNGRKTIESTFTLDNQITVFEREYKQN